MKYFIAVLLSVFILWTTEQNTPVHKSFADTASAHRATVAPKVPTATKTPQVQPVTTTPAVTPVVVPVQPTTHQALMAAAGISPEDYGAVDYIISHESGWDADATNPSSGAHGLPQALPYSKTGCGWVDAVCQLSWANTYAYQRYGGWWSAQAYWASHGNW